MTTARLRPMLLNLGLLAAATAFACGAAEVGLRLARPQPLEAALVWPDGTLRHRPSFTYRYSRSEFSNEVRFNALGLRGAEVPQRKTPGVPRVLVMGDSFVEGKQVGEEEVLTARLADRAAGSGSPLEVINAGVAGYGTGEVLHLWDRLASRLDPDVVVLGFYPNDVRNNVERRLFRMQDGRVVPWREPRRPRVRWLYDLRKVLAAHSHLYVLIKTGKKAWRERAEERLRREAAGDEREGREARLLETEEVFEIEPLPEIAAGWELTEALLGELRRRVESSGALFLVALFPTRFQVDEALWLEHAAGLGIDPSRYDLDLPGRRLGEWARREGVRLIDLLGAFRAANRGNAFYYSIDAHWNAAGHELAAEGLHAAIQAAISREGPPRGL